MKTLGQFLEEAKATYCGRCGTRHVPPSKGGTCPALKEGSIPTADEPTEHDKKMAQKVRDLLAKEKKPVKEETELTEMDKERGSRRDYDTRRGVDKTAKPMTTKKFAADALKTLNKEETEIEDAGTPHEFRKQKIIHKGEHVATIHTYRGRAGGWVSSAHTPDGKSASKKYGIDLMDTKKQMISKIKNYHKGN